MIFVLYLLSLESKILSIWFVGNIVRARRALFENMNNWFLSWSFSFFLSRKVLLEISLKQTRKDGRALHTEMTQLTGHTLLTIRGLRESCIYDYILLSNTVTTVRIQEISPKVVTLRREMRIRWISSSLNQRLCSLIANFEWILHYIIISMFYYIFFSGEFFFWRKIRRDSTELQLRFFSLWFIVFEKNSTLWLEVLFYSSH